MAVTRFGAGMVAVVGVASALVQSGFRGTDANGNGVYGPIIEPWIAQVVILVVSVILVERAFRRDSTAFILAAAAGLIIALTNFNFSYLASSTYFGLLVEGGILLTVGFGADRLRRRLSRPRPAAPGASPGAPPAAADERHGPAVIDDL